MQIVKVRRVGNSNVVSIPKELEEQGFTPGTAVMVEATESGELLIVPATHLREHVRNLAKRFVEDHSEALEILENHEPEADESSSSQKAA